MPASNTWDCFYEFVGQRFVGFTLGKTSRGSEIKIMVFEDGRGLALCSNGSYWIEGVDEVRRAVVALKEKLDRARLDIERQIALLGETT